MINIEKTDISNIEITYSNKQSRPSKTLIDENMYIEYTKINKEFNLYKNLNNLILKECVNYFNFNNSLNRDYITINSDKYKLLNIDDKNFINSSFIDFINKNNNIIIYLDNLHNYIKLQLIVYISNFFEKSTLIFSKLSTRSIVVLNNRLNEIDLNLKDKKYIRDLNIKVLKELQTFIFKKNKAIFKNMIESDKIINMYLRNGKIEEIYDQIELTNSYFNNYVENFANKEECTCKDLYYNLFLKCYVCKNCYALHYLDEDLVLDHSSAADLNPFL